MLYTLCSSLDNENLEEKMKKKLTFYIVYIGSAFW